MELDAKTLEACGRVRSRDDVIRLVTAERERCANIALAIDSGRGNEKQIARAIQFPER